MPFFVDARDHYFFYRHNPAGLLIYFSETVTTVLGYSSQSCINHFFDYLTDSPINQGVTERISQAVSGERQPPFEIEVFHHNGAVHRLEITMVPQLDENGQMIAIESVAHDITKLHYSLSGYKRKSILLDETEKIALMGTWDWNMLTDVVRWSPAFHQIMGTSPEQVTPSADAYVRYLEKADREQLVDKIVGAIKNNKTFEHAHRVSFADGSVKYLESRGKTLLNAQGKPIRMIGTVHDVSQRVETQSQLEKVYKLINSSVNEIYLFNVKDYRFSFVSEGACRNLGYSQAEAIQMTPFDLCPVIPKIQIMELLSPIVEHLEQQVIFEASHLRKDGSTYPVEVRVQLIEKGDTPLFMAIALDISSKILAQQQARSQAALLRSVIDATPDLIFFKDKDGCYLGCNKAFEKYANRGEQQIVGFKDQQLFDGSDIIKLHDNQAQILKEGVADSQQQWVTYEDKSKVLLETQITPYYCADGNVKGVVGISRDVTEHWQYEKQLKEQKDSFEHSAHYDSLTNLPNRLLFKDRLGQSLNKAKRNQVMLAVFFIDLDHFKPINDELGHDVGDKVLQEVAVRLTSCVREMDTIARLGGDEFTVIMEEARQPQSAAIVAHKMNQALQKTFIVGEHDLSLSASIGISLYPDNGLTIDELLKCADMAMYRVKTESRNAFGFYTENTTGLAFERALMESQLRIALKNNELCLCYQPQMSLPDNKIIGIEALVRWDHPYLGLILPAKFIPLAEDVGLIQAIDEWVLETACTQMAKWHSQGIDNIRVAVNLSSAQLLRNNLFDIVSDTLQRTACDPHWLALEVVEGCFSNKPEQAEKLFNQLSTLGVELVLDDFGTGYTSLTHLRQLPVTKLKIDRSFINNVSKNADDAAVAKAVISLAKSLGLTVIAEGVETQAQCRFLVQESCDQAQGYLYSRPVNARMMSKRLLE